MVVLFDKLQGNNLGYAAIFACMGIGFLFLRTIDTIDIGTGHWSLGFFFNGLGFVFWSGAVPLSPWAFYLAGEAFHVAGFMLLVLGAFRFTGATLRRRDIFGLSAWFLIWIFSMLLYKDHTVAAVFTLKALRSAFFLWAGILLIVDGKKERVVGIDIAGVSLVVWGVYLLVFAFISINPYLYYGFLVGFHVLSAFGMVAMVMDRVRARAESSERQLRTLEGILPICAYCKKIRDSSDNWQTLELYIEDRSKAEFSHGICPECFAKHRPDR
jgi:hypothetical protein